MIKMSVTENDRIDISHVHSHNGSIEQKQVALSRVEQQPDTIMLNQIRKAMLRSGVSAGIVVGKNRNNHHIF
jgi:hypothetical protein